MSEEEVKTKAPAENPRQRDTRVITHKLLTKILQEGLSIDDAWSKAKELLELEPRDKAFCRLLTLTVLRYLGYLDHRIAQYAKNIEKLPPGALMALRIGFAQIIFLKTAPHAVVNSCVNILPARDKIMRGVVNAILRKASRDETPIEDHASVWEYCIPVWLFKTWSEDYGVELSSKFAKASVAEPSLDITVKENLRAWQETLHARLLPTGSLRLDESVDITQLPGFHEGAWWVQDAASALPALLAGDVKGKLIYDCCAAPGGKTAQFIARGAQVVALDQSPQRIKRLEENLARLGMHAEIVCKNLLEFKPDKQADIVFLDAPCSATGTLRRHPDLMHHKHTADIARLAELQKKLIAHAATLVKSGGLLIYAVCSLQYQESEHVINSFLASHSDFARVPVTKDDLNGWEEGVTITGDLRTLPHYMEKWGGMDGFYAARLKKR